MLTSRPDCPHSIRGPSGRVELANAGLRSHLDKSMFRWLLREAKRGGHVPFAILELLREKSRVIRSLLVVLFPSMDSSITDDRSSQVMAEGRWTGSSTSLGHLISFETNILAKYVGQEFRTVEGATMRLFALCQGV